MSLEKYPEFHKGMQSSQHFEDFEMRPWSEDSTTLCPDYWLMEAMK